MVCPALAGLPSLPRSVGSGHEPKNAPAYPAYPAFDPIPAGLPGNQESKLLCHTCCSCNAIKIYSHAEPLLKFNLKRGFICPKKYRLTEVFKEYSYPGISWGVQRCTIQNVFSLQDKCFTGLQSLTAIETPQLPPSASVAGFSFGRRTPTPASSKPGMA